MTKKMRLMALGLSMVLFTGCGIVDDLGEKYTEEDDTDQITESNRKEVTVVTKTITMDGEISDWEGIEPVIIDPVGDVVVYSGLDISAIYVAQDSNNFYVRVDRVSSTDLPSSKEYYNYWIKFQYDDITDFGIEAFHDPERHIRLHKGDYNIVIEHLDSHVLGTHMEFSIPKGYMDFTEYTIEYFTHHTVDHAWKDDNGECGCDSSLSPTLLF